MSNLNRVYHRLEPPWLECEVISHDTKVLAHGITLIFQTVNCEDKIPYFEN